MLACRCAACSDAEYSGDSTVLSAASRWVCSCASCWAGDKPPTGLLAPADAYTPASASPSRFLVSLRRSEAGCRPVLAVASGWRAAGADDMAWMSRIASDTRPRVCDTTLSRVREMASVTPGDIARGRSTPSAPGPDLASGPRCTAPMAGDGVRAGDERCGEMPSRCWICARIRAVLLASGSSVDTNAVPPDVAGCLPGVRRPWLSSSRW